jgi:hypothetical protein
MKAFFLLILALTVTMFGYAIGSELCQEAPNIYIITCALIVITRAAFVALEIIRS